MKIKTIVIVAGIAVGIFVLILGARLLWLKRSVTIYREYWKTQANQPIPSGALVYVALGDSAAQGIGASRPERGYVGLVAEYVREQTGRDVRVINISVTGARIADVIRDQLPQLAGLPQPDLMTIEIGANDVTRYDRATFASNYAVLLAALPDKTVVANIPSFAGGRFFSLKEVSQEASREASSQIQAASRFAYADLHTATTGLGTADFAADYFHPSDQAYKKWAAAFISAIEKAELLK